MARVTDARLQELVNTLARPLSPEFTSNRYPQDVRELVQEIMTLRREHEEALRAQQDVVAEVLRRLRALPLEDVVLEDGPLEITAKAQAFFLDYQRGLWGQQETARLKKKAERAQQGIEEGKRREDRLTERVAGLESAYAEKTRLASDLTEQVHSLTENLAAATQRETMHAERVRVLEQERAEDARTHAMELSLVRSAQDTSENAWMQMAGDVVAILDRARLQLTAKVSETAAAHGKEVRNGQSVTA